MSTALRKITVEDIQALRALLSMERVSVDAEVLEQYSHDETEDLRFLPDVVVFPENAKEVSMVLDYCNHQKIAVTPVAGRTGLSGGSLPVNGGVSLSISRMNRIIQIDEKNLQVTVEPAVITQVLQEAVAAKGLYYPPDPSSRGSCFIGGNLAENAGGPHAVKYGVTKDFVLNLEVVTPSGEIFWTGANTLKNSTGYNLTQLMVGSEGTLAVITQAVLKLIPMPAHNLLMLVPFNSSEKACGAVSAIFRQGIVPSALEFMERDAIDWTLPYVEGLSFPVGPEVQAHLLIEVDGNYLETLWTDCEKIVEIVGSFESGEVLIAEDENQKQRLWTLRRKVGEAVKSHSIYKEEDAVVPRYFLPDLLRKVKEVGRKYGFTSVCYGHAGDGNLHINIIRGELDETTWNEELPKAIREIFHYTCSLGGTLSGEHGIGYVQREYMDIAFQPSTIDLMRAIKKVFDPNGVLNPGKVFPSHK